jgi:hypothetical protein
MKVWLTDLGMVKKNFIYSEGHGKRKPSGHPRLCTKTRHFVRRQKALFFDFFLHA